MAAGYTVDSNGTIALSASTAKTVLSVINAANSLIRIVEFALSFDGTSGTATPALIELCYSTQAGVGASTSTTPQQVRGPTRTVQASGARNYTSEPTVLTTWKRWLVHPQTGIIVQFPLGREPECVVTADALCLRCTAAASVNVAGYIEFEEG
ncbi:MAG TPA: hypothetical protein VFS24_17345 [Steroidobacteraceae bacterium]|nr:hypothetical protein [Steroidobacteraceae bacterium]